MYALLLVAPQIHSMPKLKPQTSNVQVQTTLNFLIGSKSNLEPDQLILEFYTPGEPNSGWIHCSWIPEGRRASFLHAYKSEGKTKYKPILGFARDVV